MNPLATAQRDLARYLTQAEAVILPSRLSEQAQPAILAPDLKLRVGVDLGTAYLVLVVTDERRALAANGSLPRGAMADGGYVALPTCCAAEGKGRAALGRDRPCCCGYPPACQVGSPPTWWNAGMSCSGLINEPSAANNVLLLREGAIVDVGGGTTGIAVLQDQQVIYTADEATGGTHFSLVIAGSLGISFEEAETLKTDPREQPRLLPLVRPVMEKVASITERHIRGREVSLITMVGGSSAFLGMAEVVQEYLGVPTRVVSHPLFVTPLGLALHDPAQ
jgi:ethanolamine utilization protein EutJ